MRFSRRSCLRAPLFMRSALFRRISFFRLSFLRVCVFSLLRLRCLCAHAPSSPALSRRRASPSLFVSHAFVLRHARDKSLAWFIALAACALRALTRVSHLSRAAWVLLQLSRAHPRAARCAAHQICFSLRSHRALASACALSPRHHSLRTAQ